MRQEEVQGKGVLSLQETVPEAAHIYQPEFSHRTKASPMDAENFQEPMIKDEDKCGC